MERETASVQGLRKYQKLEERRRDGKDKNKWRTGTILYQWFRLLVHHGEDSTIGCLCGHG